MCAQRPWRWIERTGPQRYQSSECECFRRAPLQQRRLAPGVQQFRSKGKLAYTPDWIGQGEKRGWDGGKMPPGLSHRDHDPQWRDHKFDRDDERGHHERTQLYTGDLERIGR